MPKKNFIRAAIDNLKEALQQFSVKRAIEARDKRALSRGKKLVRQLEKTYTNKEIAQALEVSPQKVTALKTQIKKGEVASKDLNDLLEDAQTRLPEIVDRPRLLEGVYTDENGEKYNIDYVQVSEEYLQKKLAWSRRVKVFASKSSALNYYGGATSGKEYFKIVKQKNGGWAMYDTRTPAELAKKNKGGVSGETRADKQIDKDIIP